MSFGVQERTWNEEELEGRVEFWHTHPEISCTLREYLGMTEKEFEAYVKNETENIEKKVIAAYNYEHNDGDQIWNDTTIFYKLNDGTLQKEFSEGYYGKTSISFVDYDEVVDTMARIESEVQRQKETIKRYGYDSIYARGGYTITTPFQK